MLRHKLLWLVRFAVTVVALAACDALKYSPTAVTTPPAVVGAPPLIRDTLNTTAWLREGITIPPTAEARGVRTASTLLTVSGADRRTLSGIDPETGRERWTVTFSGPTGSWAGVGTTFVARWDSAGLPQEVALDATSGTRLWSRPASAQQGRVILDASANVILEQVGDTAFVGRDRATGTVRWTRQITLSTCFSTVVSCTLPAGYANGAFYVVRYPGDAPLQLIRLTEGGEIYFAAFNDPTFNPDRQIFSLGREARVDPSGGTVIVNSLTGAFAVDAVLLTARWRLTHALVAGAAIEPPKMGWIEDGRGGLLVHLVYPYAARPDSVFSYEIVVNGATGETLRQLRRPGTPSDVVFVGQCGRDGMTLVAPSGQATYIDTRTGAETRIVVSDPITAAARDIPTPTRFAESYSPGILIFNTGSNADVLYGFRCRP